MDNQAYVTISCQEYEALKARGKELEYTVAMCGDALRRLYFWATTGEIWDDNMLPRASEAIERAKYVLEGPIDAALKD